jgi:hypothetical protein
MHLDRPERNCWHISQEGQSDSPYRQNADRLCNYMEMSPSREANSCSAIQEIPRMLWNRKLFLPLLIPILSQVNPVHTPILFH